MYKKTADLHHLHERTASHATKGSGRGTVWWNASDSEAFDLVAEHAALRRKKRDLERKVSGLFAEFSMIREAVRTKDLETIRALRPAQQAFRKIVRNIEWEIDAIKEKLKPFRNRRLK